MSIDSKKSCRFCLSSNTSNPFLSPCKCKGSLEFVHLKCLNHWRRMDFERNGRFCSLCQSNYLFTQLTCYETIPETNTITLYILSYPGIVSLVYHYISIFLMTTKLNQDTLLMETLYVLSQYFIHIFYMILFVKEWNVQNKKMYLYELKTIWTPVLLGLHYFLFAQLENGFYIVSPVLSFYLGLYWNQHIKRLQTINDTLVNIEYQ